MPACERVCVSICAEVTTQQAVAHYPDWISREKGQQCRERRGLWRTREKGDGNWKEGVKGSAMMSHMIYLGRACLASRLRRCIGAFVEGQGTEIASSVPVPFFRCIAVKAEERKSTLQTK